MNELIPTVEVNKIHFEGQEIKVIGLESLLSDVRLWVKKKDDLNPEYSRRVIRQNGKTLTILEKEQANEKDKSILLR